MSLIKKCIINKDNKDSNDLKLEYNGKNIKINITINNKYKIVSLCVKFISIKLKFKNDLLGT